MRKYGSFCLTLPLTGDKESVISLSPCMALLLASSCLLIPAYLFLLPANYFCRSPSLLIVTTKHTRLLWLMALSIFQNCTVRQHHNHCE
jgi:hypothetical protein